MRSSWDLSEAVLRRDGPVTMVRKNDCKGGLVSLEYVKGKISEQVTNLGLREGLQLEDFAKRALCT